MIPDVIRSAPVFRSFDAAKARGFYVDWLGFEWTGEHRFHGDATPGSTAIVYVEGLAAWRQSLPRYPNMRPGLETLPWGTEMVVTDPFGNRLRLLEQSDGA